MNMVNVWYKVKTYFNLYLVDGLSLFKTLWKIKQVYQYIPTYSISKQFRQENAPDDPNYIYGELSVLSFLYVLKRINLSQPMQIIDLGCGDAKLMCATALFFKQAHCTGVEVVSELTQAGHKALQQLQADINAQDSVVEIILDNFFTIDLNNYTTIYINGAAYKQNVWNQLTEKFNKIPSGFYVITVDRKIESDSFTLVYLGKHKASWGPAWIYVYQKR